MAYNHTICNFSPQELHLRGTESTTASDFSTPCIQDPDISQPFNTQNTCPSVSAVSAASVASRLSRVHTEHTLLNSGTGASPDVPPTTTIMDDVRAPPEQANPGASSEANPLPPTSAGGITANGPLPIRQGHELPFVAPSSYLRPKQTSRTMSDKTPSPLDKDQMQGLVSIYPFGSSLFTASPLLLACFAGLEDGCDAGFREPGCSGAD